MREVPNFAAAVYTVPREFMYEKMFRFNFGTNNKNDGIQDKTWNTNYNQCSAPKDDFKMLNKL